jgi:hypothetical protein
MSTLYSLTSCQNGNIHLSICLLDSTEVPRPGSGLGHTLLYWVIALPCPVPQLESHPARKLDCLASIGTLIRLIEL